MSDVTTFDKVALVTIAGQVIDIGTLSIHPDRLELDGKKAMTSITDIDGVEADANRVRVLHGTGDALSISYLLRSVVGMPHTQREKQRELLDALRQAYGAPTLSATDEQQVERYDEAVREAKLAGAKKSIWLGALFLVGGVLVTAITYSNASDDGGSYWLAWGPILFGLLALITGLVNAAKYGGHHGAPGRPA